VAPHPANECADVAVEAVEKGGGCLLLLMFVDSSLGFPVGFEAWEGGVGDRCVLGPEFEERVGMGGGSSEGGPVAGC
jgi:hypothetical protein